MGEPNNTGFRAMTSHGLVTVVSRELRHRIYLAGRRANEEKLAKAWRKERSKAYRNRLGMLGPMADTFGALSELFDEIVLVSKGDD